MRLGATGAGAARKAASPRAIVRPISRRRNLGDIAPCGRCRASCGDAPRCGVEAPIARISTTTGDPLELYNSLTDNDLGTGTLLAAVAARTTTDTFVGQPTNRPTEHTRSDPGPQN